MYGYSNNKNAEKWTGEAVCACLQKIEADVLTETLPYLNASFTNLRMSRRAWPYWKKKFANDEEIMDHMDVIEGLCEKKLFKAAMTGDMPVSIAIFALKNNHQWTDRPWEILAIEQKPERLPMIIEIDEYRTDVIP